MSEKRFVFTEISFEPTMETVHLAKLYHGSMDDPRLARLLERCAAAAKPKAAAVCLDVGHDAEGHVVRIGGEAMSSPVLDAQLGGLHRVFGFVATCGQELAAVDYEGSNEIRMALLSICIAGMNAAAAKLTEALRADYALGKTAVLNPGSLPEWPVSEQRKLFRLLEAAPERIGVKLLDNCFMEPLATSSGLLFETDRDYQNCTYCTILDCPARRAPYEAAKAQALRG